MVATVATQSRNASFIASFKVAVPMVTGITSAPSMRILATFSAWRRVSSSPMYTTQSRPKSAQAVAVATPCCPAPVSAITLRLPIRLASSTCPSTLLILWEPVWARSSRLSRTVPPAASENRCAGESRVGLPA